MLTDLSLATAHPSWCDPRLCTATVNWHGDGSTFVVHEAVLLLEGRHRVDVSQAVTLNKAGAVAEAEPPAVRVVAPCDGYMTAAMAGKVAEALTLAAVLAEQPVCTICGEAYGNLIEHMQTSH